MASFVPIATTLLVRERAGLVVYTGPPSITPEDGILPAVSPKEVPTITGALVRLPPLYSPDGQYLALVKERITLHSPTGELVSEIPCSDASSMEFSPRSSFLLTWSKPLTAGKEGSAPEGNLKVWESSSGRLVTSFFQKSFKRDAVQFTSDERFYCRAVNNEVHILNAADFTAGIITKVYHKGVTQFKISPVAVPDSATSSSSSYVVVVFNAEAGGNPARATLYKFSPGRGTVDGPVSSRTMFSASEAVMHFNSSGSAVLVHTQCDVDHSNSSYYGASGLYLMTADGNISAPVAQSKEGPIHDVKWGPAGSADRFVVSAGTMPCHTTLYNAKGESLYQFGAAHRNTISWSPHGRFLAIAGFGNLAGDMDFFDTLRLRKMGSNNAHCSVTYGWSPCSRYFMTATLAPRMNVDNGFKVFKYNGEGPVVNVRIEQAFDAMWQPAAAGVYPARGPSPRRDSGGAADTEAASSSSASSAKASPAAASSAPKPYRPPGSSGSLSEMMRRGDDAASAAGKVKPAGATAAGGSGGAKPSTPFAAGGARPRVIPGMPPPGAAPATGPKAAKAKDADPAAKAAATAKKAADAAERRRKEEADAAAAAAAAVSKVPVVLSAAEVAALSSEEKEKRCKAVRKKLKQIEEIKEKQKAATAPLNADQLGKLEAETELLRELELLSK